MLSLLLLAALDTRELGLVWQAPPSCPSADDVTLAIERALGRPLRSAARPSLWLAVRVTEKPRWEAILVTRAGATENERRLSAGDCGSLVQAVALIAALALAPIRPEPPVQPETSVAPVVTSTPATVSIAPRRRPFVGRPRPPPLATRQGGYRLGLGLGLQGRLLPQLGPQMGVWGGWAQGRWGLDLGAILRPPTSRSVGVEGVQVSLWAGRLRGQGAVALGTLEGVWGLGAELGWFEAQGLGATTVRSARVPWLAALTDIGARAPLVGNVWGFMRFEITAALTRPHFIIDGIGELYRPARWGLGGSAGVEIRFDD